MKQTKQLHFRTLEKSFISNFMKNWVLGLIILSAPAIAQDKHLVCNGVRNTSAKGISGISPDFDPVTVTFDERKKYVESNLLFPTCGNDMNAIKRCECIFDKTTISCSGLSKSATEPKNIWQFSFTLNRVSGKLSGLRHFSGSGNIEEPFSTSTYDYICKIASVKF